MPLNSRSSVIHFAERKLADHGVEDARLNAQLLLSHILGCDRADLVTHSEEEVPAAQLALFHEFLERRCRREPLQYILGETEFMGMTFAVDRRVFIPRPETEILVESVLQFLASRAGIPWRVLEIGTGSGNIAIVLAAKHRTATIDTLDNSAGALEVARRNIAFHRVSDQVRVISGDVFDDEWYDRRQPYDVIVSNPPYISNLEYGDTAPEIRDFEPVIATTDRRDGLSYYRRIAELGKWLLKIGGKIFLEIAYDQPDQVFGILRNSGCTEPTLIHDYAGLPRVVIAGR